eukprot:5167637-Prymnesium_polylepis.3
MDASGPGINEPDPPTGNPLPGVRPSVGSCANPIIPSKPLAMRLPSSRLSSVHEAAGPTWELLWCVRRWHRGGHGTLAIKGHLRCTLTQVVSARFGLALGDVVLEQDIAQCRHL